jgi:uncharacterized protein (TIGR00369 family)
MITGARARLHANAMTEQTQTAFDFVLGNLGRTPFHQWLKPELISVDEERGGVLIHLPIRPEFNRRPDEEGVHGGVVAALIDIAGHAAIASRLRHGAATIDLRVDYLRLATGAELRAVATVVKFGRTIGVVDVRIDDNRDKTVAIGRAAYLTQSILEGLT